MLALLRSVFAILIIENPGILEIHTIEHLFAASKGLAVRTTNPNLSVGAQGRVLGESDDDAEDETDQDMSGDIGKKGKKRTRSDHGNIDPMKIGDYKF